MLFSEKPFSRIIFWGEKRRTTMSAYHEIKADDEMARAEFKGEITVLFRS